MGGSPGRAGRRDEMDESRSAARVGAQARVRPKPTALIPGGKMESGTISSSISARGSTPPAIEISAPTGLGPGFPPLPPHNTAWKTLPCKEFPGRDVVLTSSISQTLNY